MCSPVCTPAASGSRTEGSDDGPASLARDYDVVLTSLEHMSSAWSSKDPVECSPLLQASLHLPPGCRPGLEQGSRRPWLH